MPDTKYIVKNVLRLVQSFTLGILVIFLVITTVLPQDCIRIIQILSLKIILDMKDGPSVAR